MNNGIKKKMKSHDRPGKSRRKKNLLLTAQLAIIMSFKWNHD
jgi:hypothetical protein